MHSEKECGNMKYYALNPFTNFKQTQVSNALGISSHMDWTLICSCLIDKLKMRIDESACWQINLEMKVGTD